MTARRYLTGCAVLAAVVAGAVLAWTAHANHETGRAHRHAKGIK